MTTVVYRDGVMAADTGLCRGSTADGQMTKIARNEQGDLAGAAGHAWWVFEFLKWFKAGSKGAPPRGGDGEAMVRLIGARGSDVLYFYADDEMPVRVLTTRSEHGYHTIGTGADVAFGALYMGATARQAVEAATRHNVKTRGPVESLESIKQPKRKRKS